MRELEAIDIVRLSVQDPDFDTRLAQLLAYDDATDEHVVTVVSDILRDVRQRGDASVLDYTRRFDHVHAQQLSELRIEPDVLLAALDNLPVAQRVALETAVERVRYYHEKQRQVSWSYTESDGTELGQIVTPLDRVGLYVPGGKAAYPSSVIMNAVPAKVAGVHEIFMVVPTPHGERNALVLAAAAMVGVDHVYTIGGAQAVAALAYGTNTLPQVDKITGPGNAYVAEAKRRVFGTVGIDMVAGPSEILVLCDGHTNPDWIAMDLFSQAEHDELAQSILVSTDRTFLDAVAASMARQLSDMPRREIIQTSLKNRGALIFADSVEVACELVNRIAPEHLELSVQDADVWLPHIRHAGAIFVGPYSSESLGDYCAGPNHVLPTGRSARFSSPLGVYDFQKRSSLLRISAQGAHTLGRVADVLARGEGLSAHAQSAAYRIIPG